MAFNWDNQLDPAITNNIRFMLYYSRLSNLAKTMFEWSGFPDSVNPDYLEKCLFERGKACFFKDDNLGYIALGCVDEGLNVYGDPIRIRPVAANTVNFREYNSSECVFIRNTPDMMPTNILSQQYARSLFDIDTARDVNIKAQKTPVLILCDRQNKTTMQAVYDKWSGNEPVIYGAKNAFDQNGFTVLRTDAPFVAGQLQDIKLSIYYEYLTMLGLGKAEFKRERQLTDEVATALAESNALANIMMSQREKACETINRMFNLNVSVSLRAKTDYYDPMFGASNSSTSYTFGGGITSKRQYQGFMSGMGDE